MGPQSFWADMTGSYMRSTQRMTAAWYWHDTKCNDPADKGDMTEVTRRVNGPALMHLAERKHQYEIALKALA